jgi:hypothetical protein
MAHFPLCACFVLLLCDFVKYGLDLCVLMREMLYWMGL